MDGEAKVEQLRVGDAVPGHLLILEGRDAERRVHVHEVCSLDEPFLGCFFPVNLYPEWRWRVVSRVRWEEEQADASAGTTTEGTWCR